MTTFETNRVVPLGSVATLRLVTLLERGYDAFVAWRNARRTTNQLTKLSDQQLADIGLERSDIVDMADRLAARI